jgi:hypothetical protein
MNSLLRKLRGLLGTGITWAVGWAIVMFLIGNIVLLVDPDSIDAGEEPWRLALMVSTVGFVSGSVFALFFAGAERRTKLTELSAWRAAWWGALGGGALPLLTAMNDSIALNTIPLGAIFAASTVAIARRVALREAAAVEELESDGEAPKLRA